jgi:hypothetical protein
MKDMNAEPKNYQLVRTPVLEFLDSVTYDRIDKGLDGPLIGVQSEPDSSHHDSQTRIHRYPDPIGNNIPITLHKRSMHQRHQDDRKVAFRWFGGR